MEYLVELDNFVLDIDVTFELIKSTKYKTFLRKCLEIIIPLKKKTSWMK